MLEVDFDLPAGWSPRLDETPDSRTVAAFEYRTGANSAFLVTISPRTEHPGYDVPVSTITPDSTNAGHEYPVRASDRRENALDGAHAIMEELTDRIARGELTTSEPGIDEINDAIESVTTRPDDSLCDWLRELLGNR